MPEPVKRGRSYPEPIVKPKVKAASAVFLPSAGALKRYGLTEEEWRAILERQNGVCAICLRLPPSGKLAIDHEHVPKWKKMKGPERRKYVRGLCCFLCNGKCVSKWATLERARRVVAYLEAYLKRSEAS